MGGWRMSAGNAFRSWLPPESPPRRLARASRGAARSFRDSLRPNHEPEPTGEALADGLDDYAEWQAQQARLSSIVGDERTTTFAVVVEVPANSSEELSEAAARTVRSVESQAGADSRALVATTGTPLSELAAGIDEDYMLFVKAGTLLTDYALNAVAKQHRVDPADHVIVFDSDSILADGEHVDPRFRPAWSPEMMLGANYIGRAFAIRTELVGSSGAWLDDRGIWRLLLTTELSVTVVGQIPRILLSVPAEAEHAASEADAAMVQEALAARGEPALATVSDGVVRVRFAPASWPSVSIVVPTRHSRTNLDRLLPGLLATDYPEFDVTIVDNGERTDEREEWYAAFDERLSVTWWTESPFNYSRVNTVTVAQTDGEIVVLLNDDTEIVDPGWLREMVGVLLRRGVGSVGYQLRSGEGIIQHGGVTVGPAGFAANLFAGLPPGSDTLAGPTGWYRNSLAVTAACVAIRRTHFDEVGGLDERFQLCGSDVVLGLDQIIRGRRNVVIPFDSVRHYESLTRGTEVPRGDFFASYWRYHPWLQGGDPYLSSNLCRLTPIPRFRSVTDPEPLQLALQALGRPWRSSAQSSTISEDATALMTLATISDDEVRAVADGHAAVAGARPVHTINWFLPEFDMPFFGGINTTLRIAAKLARDHGVVNRFLIFGNPSDEFFSSAIEAAFPELRGSEVGSYIATPESIGAIPEADAAVATFWLTAFHVAKFPHAARKFYLMQDYEPSFYPASTLFGMAEQTYELGLYGICNTESMHRIYSGAYHGVSTYFTPAVDRSIFHAQARQTMDRPVTIFAYARDHFRNRWELVFAALSEIKRRYGDDVRIIAAGARYLPASADFIDLGLLDFRATGRLYRETDIGVSMQISRHPSYLPLELMASEVAMVAPDSSWFRWLFRGGENSLLSMGTLDSLVDKVDQLVRDPDLRRRIGAKGRATIDESHSDWDDALDGLYDYFCDPERFALPTSGGEESAP
jgi:O-antigen biosynthesis protein